MTLPTFLLGLGAVFHIPFTPLLMGSDRFEALKTSLRNLDTLESRLSGLLRDRDADDVSAVPVPPFASLALDAVTFTYEDVRGNPGFAVGPASLVLKPGEVVFLVGGNGSGKSTLLNVLAGVFPPQSGEILLNGRPVGWGTQQQVVSAIFADFFLFDRIYGVDEIDGDQVSRLLRQMRIDHKTAFAGQQFTRRDLSTGQRKRLALIDRWLRDLPVWILDEWAADQDPDFRRYFHLTLLPELAAAGKALLVVSHDERYFHCADRIYVMDEGRLGNVPDCVDDCVFRPNS